MTLSLLVILGTFLLAIIGAAIPILFAKEEIKDAFVPGIIAGILILVVGFFVALGATYTLIGALVLGIVMQLVLPAKKVEEMIG